MIDKFATEQTSLDLYVKHVKRGVPAKMMPKIIVAEGIKLREIDGGEKFSGALVKSPSGVMYININKNIDNTGRKNFTLAHELGHFALQHHLHTASFLCSENEISEDDEAISDQEKEANYFASCFLLPRNRVVSEFTKWFQWRISPNGRVFLNITPHGKSYSEWKAISNTLQNKFDVSTTALKIRLVELVLINDF